MAFISNTGQKTYKNDLQGAFESLQEQRSELLNLVRDTQLATRTLVVHEARRLRDKGDPDDARIAQYTRGSEAILRRATALEVEAQIANIRVPPVTKTETLLQGRITDEGAKAVAHVTVSLVDDAGKLLANVPPVETDDSGYYAFILQPEQVAAIGANKRQLSLQVGNSSGKLVPAAAAPFELVSGKVMAHETRLQAGELDKLQLRFKAPGNGKAGATAKRASAPKKT
ncbi:MAG: hypothetical protein EOP38_09570 [Rubrivivax sp.]|nr:MAG: hypothetical protein EOP38_09570 [Rubrivivax sp.]